MPDLYTDPEARKAPRNCGAFHATLLEITTGPRHGREVFCVVCGRQYRYEDLPLEEHDDH